MRKFTYKQAVQLARDIVTEGEANSSSGDPRQAAEGRRTAIFGQLFLQLVSSFTEAEFNDIRPAIVSASDQKSLPDPATNVGATDAAE